MEKKELLNLAVKHEDNEYEVASIKLKKKLKDKLKKHKINISATCEAWLERLAENL